MDEETKCLLDTLSQMREARGDQDHMLLLEGQYCNNSVFVRDILLDQNTPLEQIEDAVGRAQALAHPMINHVVLARQEGHRIVVLSERAEESVKDKLYRARSIRYEETLTKEDALEIASTVCQAAKYLHKNGVSQLGLRPASILVLKDGEYRLSETCLSPLLAGEPCETTVFESCLDEHEEGAVLGKDSGLAKATIKPSVRTIESRLVANSKTFPLRKGESSAAYISGVEYLAPEVLGGGVATPQADVFAFGILLWQLLHLRQLYPKEWGAMQIYKSLRSGNRPAIDASVVSMESPLRKLLQLCWASEPERRPSFEEISRMLLVAKQFSQALARSEAGQDLYTNAKTPARATHSTQADFIEYEEFVDDSQIESPPPSPYANIDIATLSYPARSSPQHILAKNDPPFPPPKGRALRFHQDPFPAHLQTQTQAQTSDQASRNRRSSGSKQQQQQPEHQSTTLAALALPTLELDASQTAATPALGQAVVAWNVSTREYLVGVVEDHWLEAGQAVHVAVAVEGVNAQSRVLWLPSHSVTPLQPNSGTLDAMTATPPRQQLHNPTVPRKTFTSVA